MDIHGLTPSDMRTVDKVFTEYIHETYGDENDARMKTVTYLVRVFGWKKSVAVRAASIAVEDGYPSPQTATNAMKDKIKKIKGLDKHEIDKIINALDDDEQEEEVSE